MRTKRVRGFGDGVTTIMGCHHQGRFAAVVTAFIWRG